MTIGNERKKIDLRHVRLPLPWEISLFLLVFYAFFFQYGVTTINGAMLVINAVCILFGIAHLILKKHDLKRSPYNWIVAFVLITVSISVVFGVSTTASIDIGIRMIEYCLTGFSIFLFAVVHKRRFIYVIFYMWLSILLLAISVLLHGAAVNSIGAVGIGTLNTNAMSSFFLLMVFCSFYLYGQTRNKMKKGLILASLLTVFFVQIQSASRRGFIVMVFMIVMNIVLAVIPYSNEENSRKKLITYSAVIIAGAIAFVGLRDYIFNNTILGQRLSGMMTGGDAARIRYQVFALEQFKRHPILGIGVGGIEYLQGVYSHSLFYETLSCTGILGSVFMLCAFFALIKKLLQNLIGENSHDVSKKGRYLNKTMLIYMLGIILSGVAVVMIYDLYFYLSLALIAAGIYWNEQPENILNEEGFA